MPFNVAIAIATFILTTTLIVMMIFLAHRKRTAKEEELMRAAAARGWKFESLLDKGYRVHRWTGVTDGVAWSAESLRLSAGGNKQKRRRHVARWHGAWSPGINGAIVCLGVPAGKEQMGDGIAQGDGFLAKLAQKAVGFAFDKAIDMYFGDGPGKEVDAGAMRRVDANTPGFIVMAADKDEGQRVLAQGLERALVGAVSDKSSLLSDQDRPWILLRPNSVSLARTEMLLDIKELDAFIQAGVGLTRVFTFGRRSPS